MFSGEDDLEQIEEKVEAPRHDPTARSGGGPELNDLKQHLLQMSEISILLDTYDDIFSDFDPRPYSQRALSDDFLIEAKKASKEKSSGRIELLFLIPKDKRNPEDEAIIKRRLHDHFKKHHNDLLEEINGTKKKSISAIFIGMLMLASATYISTRKSEDFLLNLLLIILEPGGWFITWFALDQLFYTSNPKKQDLDFYSKMSKSEIDFITY